MQGDPLQLDHALAIPHMFWDNLYATQSGHMTAHVIPTRKNKCTQKRKAKAAAPDDNDNSTKPNRYTIRFDGQPPPVPLTSMPDTLCYPTRLLYEADPHSAAIIQHLQQSSDTSTNSPPTARQLRAQKYMGDAQTHRLFYNDPTGKRRLYIPEEPELPTEKASIRDRLIHAVHAPIDAGYRGTDATVARLQRTFYWKNMRLHVQRIVAGCECQMAKASTQQPMGLYNLAKASAQQPMGLYNL